MEFKGKFIKAKFVDKKPRAEAIALMNIIKKLDGDARLIRIVAQFLHG